MTPMGADAVRAALTARFVPGKALDLTRRHVTGPLDLRGLTVSGFDLSGSVFEGPVDLSDATFLGLTWLRNCRFAAGLRGMGTLFGHDLRLDGCDINGDLTLTGAEMRGTFVLDDATLGGATDLRNIQALSSLSCARTLFRGALDLSGAECLGGIWADSAGFESGVIAEQTEVHGRTWLRNSRVGGPSPRTLQTQLVTYGYLWE
ncbi:pentapeptide repeat-containing protein [Marinovum sp. 2_MG-2023]|uniref:pentapeptide repeat-containing protein n=1 Tax=unclassified Marinovum TaxID=2647166 RepID=UPI0026E28E78|nr:MULTISPECIES: pentapeptide repeat-containing protein [unclassified Marinovum]MDO6729039.1 pentapeptide repeat-containing protein [Marinovum sp. 2_MG-2023]MDO6779334.1 pentapeptide repeat-containing protein [Marinovum sp. 1_MG-2023]